MDAIPYSHQPLPPGPLRDQLRERAQAYEELSPTYHTDRFGYRFGRFELSESRALIRHTIQRIFPRGLGNWSALDVAAGSGKVALAVAEMGGKVVALDMAEGMLNQCRKLARQDGLQRKLNFTRASADSMPFPDNTFDVVLSFRFLHLLPQTAYPTVFREMARVTKPGGHVVVEMKNRWYGGIIYHVKDQRRRLRGGISFSSYVGPRQLGRVVGPNVPLSLQWYSGLLLPRAWAFSEKPRQMTFVRWLARKPLKWFAAHFVAVYQKS